MLSPIPTTQAEIPIVDIEISTLLLSLSVISPADRLERIRGPLKYKPLT